MIMNSCGEYEVKRVSHLQARQNEKKFDEVFEMIQLYCESDTGFKLDGRLKTHLRSNSNTAHMFNNMARLFHTAKRDPSIATFLKELDKEPKRAMATQLGVVSNSPITVTNSTLIARLDEAARQVDCMMQYLTSVEEAVDRHHHMTQHINRIHVDDIVLGSAHRADARMIVEPVREWWMIMAGSMATAMLNNHSLRALDLIPAEVREVINHLVKAVRNLFAHNRVDQSVNSSPTSDDVATLRGLPRISIGVALTSAKPGENSQTDLYTDIAYHDIIRETNRKLRAVKLSAVIQRARSSLSAS